MRVKEITKIIPIPRISSKTIRVAVILNLLKRNLSKDKVPAILQMRKIVWHS